MAKPREIGIRKHYEEPLTGQRTDNGKTALWVLNAPGVSVDIINLYGIPAYYEDPSSEVDSFGSDVSRRKKTPQYEQYSAEVYKWLPRKVMRYPIVSLGFDNGKEILGYAFRHAPQEDVPEGVALGHLYFYYLKRYIPNVVVEEKARFLSDVVNGTSGFLQGMQSSGWTIGHIVNTAPLHYEATLRYMQEHLGYELRTVDLQEMRKKSQ